MTRMDLDQFVAKYGICTTSNLPFKEAVNETIRKGERNDRNGKRCSEARKDD